ncbi:glycosyltransferase [Arthrobacter sp. AK04]|uniref:glycosyltransferase n=1 Tax=Arthrobacter sp. AK04 TaxID=2900048 RepID=UPI001E596720|nr:glycosyltransferase [Arthrobacter sp. AK04]MCD5343528.1 glycosyltransferase [Arthrobacter sp. AK04]
MIYNPRKEPSIFEHQHLKVLWVTNLAAPYRVPVWRDLGRRCDLTVALLESNAGLQRDAAANRGQDWHHQTSQDFIFAELPAWKVSRGESRFYFLKSIKAAMSVSRYNVVLFGGWESPAYWVLMLACMVSRTARVAFYESPKNTMTHTSGPVSFLRAGFFRCMNKIVVPGAAAYEAVTGMGVRPNNVLQGFNAVDVRAFHEAALSEGDRAANKAPNGHSYLYVGQLIDRKRVQDIVDSFIRVAEQEDRLTIVGTGERLDELKKLAGAHEAQISFLGHVENSELPKIMAAHHTLVLASNREVWGLVVNEALASGMHVVVTENCGVSRSVRSMHGVHIVTEDLQDLGEQMKISRNKWTGRVQSPEILQYTPAHFAEVFYEAFKTAQGAPTCAAENCAVRG